MTLNLIFLYVFVSVDAIDLYHFKHRGKRCAFLTNLTNELDKFGSKKPRRKPKVNLFLASIRAETHNWFHAFSPMEV